MSKFITAIPVDFDALVQHVPKNTYIYSATLSEDRKSVSVVWDNPALVSPVAGAWPYPIENVRAGTLPERVTLADWAQAGKDVRIELPTPPPAEPVAVKRGKKG